MKTQRWLVVGAFAVVLAFLVILPLLISGSAPETVTAAPVDAPLGMPKNDTATCRTYTSRDVPKIIPDDTITNTRSFLNVPLAGRISAITVTVNISHTYPADLEINLCAEDMTGCLLTDGGLTSDSGQYEVSWSSASETTLGDPPYSGAYAAEDSLMDFIGKRAAGKWWLVMRDTAGGDTGTLESWELEICALPTQGTATPTVTPTPTPTMVPGVYLFQPYLTNFMWDFGGKDCATGYYNNWYFSGSTVAEYLRKSGSRTDSYRQADICVIGAVDATCDIDATAYESCAASDDCFAGIAWNPYTTATPGSVDIRDSTPPAQVAWSSSVYVKQYSNRSAEVIAKAGHYNYNTPYPETSLSVSCSLGATFTPVPTATPYTQTPTPTVTPTSICPTPAPLGFGWWFAW